jgi:hypothetical protein
MKPPIVVDVVSREEIRGERAWVRHGRRAGQWTMLQITLERGAERQIERRVGGTNNVTAAYPVDRTFTIF